MYDFVRWMTGNDGDGKVELDVGALVGEEWIAACEATCAGECVSHPLPKIKHVATAAAATGNLERADGEIISSPTYPVP